MPRSTEWPPSVPAGAGCPWCCAAPGLVCPFPLTAVHTDVSAADATCRHWCAESLAWLYFPHCPGFWLFGIFSSQGCLCKWICHYYKSAVFKRCCPKPKQHQCNLLNLPWSGDVGGVRTAITDSVVAGYGFSGRKTVRNSCLLVMWQSLVFPWSS